MRARAARCRSASRNAPSVVKPSRAGEFLTYENCVPNDGMVITQIRRRLDQADSEFLTNAA